MKSVIFYLLAFSFVILLTSCSDHAVEKLRLLDILETKVHEGGLATSFVNPKGESVVIDKTRILVPEGTDLRRYESRTATIINLEGPLENQIGISIGCGDTFYLKKEKYRLIAIDVIQKIAILQHIGTARMFSIGCPTEEEIGLWRQNLKAN